MNQSAEEESCIKINIDIVLVNRKVYSPIQQTGTHHKWWATQSDHSLNN
jgi:hypothetical protein